MSATTPAALHTRPGEEGPANASARPGVAPGNRVQRDLIGQCADCGVRVRRVHRARGPLPARCPACSASHRPLVQLRAYLRTAVRLAQVLELADVADAVTAALAVLDAAEIER